MNKISFILLFAATVLLSVAWPIALSISLNQALDKFFDSIFVLTSFSTFFAAFFGAWGAQHIIERKQLLQEIRNVNAAITTSFTICSALIGLKKQHVISIYQQFLRDKSAYYAVLMQAASLPIGQRMETTFQGDFRSLQLQKLPTELLQNQVFEKVSALGRPLALAITLNQSAGSLWDSVNMRNDLIQSFRSVKNEKLAEIYFGINTGSSHDNTYSDLVSAIYNQLDDCIYFSELLCKDLQDHGETIRNKIGKSAPRIARPNFSDAYKQGLMPDPRPYQDWENSFTKA